MARQGNGAHKKRPPKVTRKKLRMGEKERERERDGDTDSICHCAVSLLR